MRVVLGILKGLIVGGLLGYGGMAVGMTSGFLGYVLYAAIGFATGVVAGKPIWRQETLWTPVVKGIFGALICTGLYWGATFVMGSVSAPEIAALGIEPGTPLLAAPVLLGPVISILYGTFVEIDDGGPGGKGSKKDAAIAPGGSSSAKQTGGKSDGPG